MSSLASSKTFAPRSSKANRSGLRSWRPPTSKRQARESPSRSRVLAESQRALNAKSTCIRGLCPNGDRLSSEHRRQCSRALRILEVQRECFRQRRFAQAPDPCSQNPPIPPTQLAPTLRNLQPHVTKATIHMRPAPCTIHVPVKAVNDPAGGPAVVPSTTATTCGAVEPGAAIAKKAQLMQPTRLEANFYKARSQLFIRMP